MKKYFDILQKCPLFDTISDENRTAMLLCLGAKIEKYEKGKTILVEGEPATQFGIVLSGTVQIFHMDYYGNRTILTNLVAPQIFGESFACAGLEAMPVDVVATEHTEVLLIDASRITQTCSNACSFHNKMIFNLLTIVAKKNIVFHQKIEITSKRSTREKLIAYLAMQAKLFDDSSFVIPYDRQELADYLEVDRSGLSVEISKLRKERVLTCKKNQFTLLDTNSKNNP